MHFTLKRCAKVKQRYHGDHTFLDNLIPLLKRWQGPISISLFTPGSDYIDAMLAVTYYRYILIQFMVLIDSDQNLFSILLHFFTYRKCLNESYLVQNYATFHFYFPKSHLPKEGELLSSYQANNYKIDCNQTWNINPTYRYNFDIKSVRDLL